MYKINGTQNFKSLEVEKGHGRNAACHASFNCDGTITLRDQYYLYDGEMQTIVLDRDETEAIIRLFKGLKLLDLIRMEEEL